MATSMQWNALHATFRRTLFLAHSEYYTRTEFLTPVDKPRSGSPTLLAMAMGALSANLLGHPMLAPCIPIHTSHNINGQVALMQVNPQLRGPRAYLGEGGSLWNAGHVPNSISFHQESKGSLEQPHSRPCVLGTGERLLTRDSRRADLVLLAHIFAEKTSNSKVVLNRSTSLCAKHGGALADERLLMC